MDPSSEYQSDAVTEPKEYSSLPLIIVASGAILVSAAAGWFLLDREAPEWTENDNEVSTSRLPPAIDGSTAQKPRIDADAELRKARLAADADILARPPGRNALYFYRRVLEAEPEHTAANAEFEAVLARVSLIVTDHLASGRYGDAYQLVELAAGQAAGHALVEAMRDTLDDNAVRLIERAVQLAQDGSDDEAAAVLTTVEALPGRSSAYVTAARDSVVAAQQSRDAAERERIEQERIAAEQSVLGWTQQVRDAIAAGRLITPDGDSARDYLAARDTPTETLTQLTDELVTAVFESVEQRLDAGEFADMELYLDAAGDLSGESDKLTELRDTLESKLVAAEGNKVLGLSDFVRLNTAPARYPRLANQYNITGWVDVLFTVTPTGATADIEVVEAEPEDVFETSAIEAVEQWTFQPREYRGRLISQRTAARLVFRLEDEKQRRQ